MAKMVKCKSCGSEIAKSAQKCPNCGAKQHQGALTAAGLIIVATIFLCAFMLLGGGKNSVQNEKAIEVSASDLQNAYSANKVNADSIYKGKLLAVTGEIEDIGQDLVEKKPCISISTGNVPIQCFFENDDNGYIASLKDGESVMIFGTCDGTPIAAVQMSDCYFESN